MNVETKAEENVREATHLLLRRTNRIKAKPATWKEWKYLFENTTDPSSLKGLLHEGFDVGFDNRIRYSHDFIPEKQWIETVEERVLYYLDVSPNHEHFDLNPSEREVAEKAMRTVSSRFFAVINRMPEEVHPTRYKKWENVSTTTVKAILDWAGIRSGDGPKDSSLWSLGSFNRFEHEPIREALVWIARRILLQWKIQLAGNTIWPDSTGLLRLQALSILLFFKSRKELFEVRRALNEQDLETIKDWALSERCSFGKMVVERIPESIEEAVCGTSFAGQMYVLLQMYYTNKDRFAKKNQHVSYD